VGIAAAAPAADPDRDPHERNETVSAPRSPHPANDLAALPVQPARPPAVGLHLAAEPAGAATTLSTLGIAGMRRVEAPSATVIVRVLARLSNGERIEVGAHEDEQAARAEATALMRFLREASGDWPFLNGRFVRPDAIVSVDVLAG
jgi:hypothetical protein